jgi:hypothetical protein
MALLKTARCFLRAATAVLLCIGLGGYRGIAEPPIQGNDAGVGAENAVSLVVCDSQTFDNCHRVEGVTRPRVLHGATPVYPLEAQRLKLEGLSVVRLVIDTHGVPRNVTTALDRRYRIHLSSRCCGGGGPKRRRVREEIPLCACDARRQAGSHRGHTEDDLPPHDGQVI